MTAKKRKLTVTLEAKSGAIQRFYVFVDGKRVIARKGNKKRSWKGEVGEQVRISLRVVGIADATFELKIDLPGTTNDLTASYSLDGGYYECEHNI